MDTQPDQQDPDTSVAPAVNPVDSADVETAPQDTGNDFDLAALNESAANLSPSEIPAINDVPAIVGVLLYHAAHGELPKPLSERFPDDNPNQ